MNLNLFWFISRDEQDPLFDKRMDHGNAPAVSGSHSNTLMNQDWEKDLMEAGKYLKMGSELPASHIFYSQCLPLCHRLSRLCVFPIVIFSLYISSTCSFPASARLPGLWLKGSLSNHDADAEDNFNIIKKLIYIFLIYKNLAIILIPDPFSLSIGVRAIL